MHDILNEPFNIINYKQLVAGLVAHEFYDETKLISYDSDVIKSAENIGTFQGNRFHNILIINHSVGIGARVKLATETFKLMASNNIDTALIAYYSKDSEMWRISLVTLTLEESSSGKISRNFSNPRRHSYVLGPDTKAVTPYKFLISKGISSDFNDLLSRFSVEVVNNEFYKEIAKLYDELVGSDEKQAVIKYPALGEASHQFAVRLIGRIVFCWFLREKHSAEGIPLISRKILSREAAAQDDYYHTVLAPLFFEVLNAPIKSRSEHFQTDEFGKVPYLNGGLFAPQDDDYYKYDNALTRSEPGVVGVPDMWLRKLLDLLELYHFTVDENTSIDIDLSIDPEMLGRIFENLLARINPETGETVRKSTGSFYTPREIVEYMVDESLIEYLKTTHVHQDKLRSLVSYSNSDNIKHSLGDGEKKLIIKALHSAKILDPACGSGAYPIGILQKIVFVLQQIDPDAKLWFENQIEHTAPEVRRLIEKEFENENFDYIRKLGIIRESIFGIDIQPIATEIARLRCFLTLIVDERVDDNEPNRGVYPLPNLDFKFVTANTLIKLGDITSSEKGQTELFEDQAGIAELKSLRDDYFNSHNSEKETLKFKFAQAQNRMLQKIIQSNHKGLAETTQKLSAWDPFNNQSTNWFDAEWMFGVNNDFDIVIGNPPYYIENDDRTRFDGLRELECYQGKMNVWYLFGGFGLDSLKSNGILCFIATNNWTTNAGASKWRNKVLTEAKFTSLLDFGSYMVFESAAQQTMVMMFVKTKDDNYEFDYRRINTPKPNKLNFLSLLDRAIFEGNEYINPEIQEAEYKNKLFTFANKENDKVLKKIAMAGSNLLNAKEVANGIHPHYDYVNKKTAKKLGQNFQVGDGIFVISQEEKDSLRLPSAEESLVKPYFTTKQLGRYHSDENNMEWIIYTDSKYKNPRSMDDFPALKRHLDQYSEVITSVNKPYGLHRAREERFFTGEKIMSLRKSPLRPAFTITTFDCYVSAAFYVIKTDRFDLWYLTGLLNSKLMAFWLKNKGKMQGGNYQIDKEPLLSIPIASKDQGAQNLVAQKVKDIYSRPDDATSIEDDIDKLIYKLYGLDSSEIAIIEGYGTPNE